MRILILHPNFPAQFQAPCLDLVQENHDIKFICQTHYGRSIDGVEKLVLKGDFARQAIEGNLTELKKMFVRADSYKFAMHELSNKNWNPDVMLSHSGWGCGFYAKHIWPQIPLISYVEWWFSGNSDLVKSIDKNPFFKFNIKGIESLLKRNALMAMELASADIMVAPTKWQKNQLPIQLRKHCDVIYDKLNEKIFYQDKSRLSPTPKVTYGTRGMEPMRGFPEFINSVEKLLHKWPSLTIEIAGKDENNYGGGMPKQGSWKKWAIEQIPPNLLPRIIWLDRMPIDKYANWLRSSWCHVYLTEPYVTSWSLLEAIQCGAPLIASDHISVQEFTRFHQCCILVDHKKQENLVKSINSMLRITADRWSSGDHFDAPNLNEVQHGSTKSQTLADLVKQVAGAEATTMH